MTNSAPLPLRTLIKGPSTMNWISMMGGPRSDLPFPRVIEQQLLAAGRPAEVRDTSRLGWMTRDLMSTWDEDVAAWSPDVVIMAPCHMETVHVLQPSWLERAANKVNRRPGVLRKIWYKRILRGASRTVLHIQRRVDRPGYYVNRRMRRALADTQAYIELTQKVGSPLMLVMELHPPIQAKLWWFGGWRDRVERLNDDLRALVERIDRPNVRFVQITDLMSRFDPGEPEDLWADGIHFSPEFHRAIGEKFAGIIDEWAKGQEHLTQP